LFLALGERTEGRLAFLAYGPVDCRYRVLELFKLPNAQTGGLRELRFVTFDFDVELYIFILGYFALKLPGTIRIYNVSKNVAPFERPIDGHLEPVLKAGMGIVR
jgi:hypothetical protein